MEFRGADTTIGKLDWSTGVLEFTGNVGKSAEILFEYFLKGLVDEYIKAQKEVWIQHGKRTVEGVPMRIDTIPFGRQHGW